jgi:UDP:flavonoid glycosyltransferase YjiC (YdhE family)
MVLAGKGQDKNITNTIVGWKEVGINLGRADPSVNEVREGVTQVLADKKFKRNAVAMSKHFERYDLGKIFDDVIQGVVRKRKKQQAE